MRQVRTGPRVGLNPRMGEAADWPWRLWVDGSPAVSPFRPGGLRAQEAAARVRQDLAVSSSAASPSPVRAR